MKSINKDTWKTIYKEKKRFVSMAVIAVLGITMFTGLKAGCDDLRQTADRFLDGQNLHDVYIQSTLGLTEDDVKAIGELDSVELASGFYTEEVQTVVEDVNKSALVKVMNPDGMDVPYVLEGTLPTAADEIAVTKIYMDETGKSLGDTLTFVETDLEKDDEEKTSTSEEEDVVSEAQTEQDMSDGADSEDETANDMADSEDEFSIDPDEFEVEEEEETPTFANTTYRITAVVIDPADINATQGSTSFRSTSTTDYTWFVLPEAVDTDIYTGIGVIIPGLKDIYCYSEDYDVRVRQVTNEIADTIKAKREQARTQQIKNDAFKTIAEVEADMNEAFADAEEQFADAWQEIQDGEQEIQDAQKELDDGLAKGKREIAKGRSQIADGYAELGKGDADIAAAEAELASGEAEIAKNEELLLAQEAELEAGESQIADGFSQLEENESMVDEQWNNFQAMKPFMPPEMAEATEQQLLAAKEQLAAGRAELESQAQVVAAGREQLEAGKAQIEAAKQEILAGKAELEQGKREAAAGRRKLDESLAKLNSEEAKMYQEIADGRAEIEDGKQELADGRAEYDENWVKYQEQKADAQAQIADAKREVADIEDAKWYIQNRYSLSGYNNVKNDMSAIESLGIVFAIIFLVVAVLISLTTVTRMVEEDRGLIGTYQAMGYRNREIRKKYLSFALLACAIGCGIGEFCGFVAFPKFLEIIFDVMYQLPDMGLGINWFYAISGPVIFLICIAVAVWNTSQSALKYMPATLMRPKAPKSGSRVFLEYIPGLWKRMSFLNKVTARNIFRYKKRFLMTVIGIAGCMAILICGFGIKDTVEDLMNRQYDMITRYSWMVTVDPDDKAELDADLNGEASVVDYISMDIESVSLVNDAGETMTIPMYILPEDTNLENYVLLEDISSKQKVGLAEDGILVTRNASMMLNFEVGDVLTIQDMQFYTNEFAVDTIVENYLGNGIYMTQALYEKTFGGYEENSAFVHLNWEEGGKSFVEAEAEKEMVLSSVSTQALKDDFSTSFALINMVVYIIIVMAAALAFVVLFTLSTTNISERERELATIKVLGFHDREVHLYVNKETIILTIIGIFAGIPLGIVMLNALTNLLKMPELYFATSIHGITYLISGILSFIFAIVVNQMTNRTLNRIDPVEALKSIE